MDKKKPTEIIKDFYDSKEADVFFKEIWGREDLHTGIYTKNQKTIKDGGKNTTLKMVKRLPSIKKSHRILDIGSGYGSAARFLAKEYGCRVDCLNLSEKQNRFNRKKIEAAELEKTVSVTTGDFKQLPFDRETYDVVWSQDALLYGTNRFKVFREVSRVLKPEGRFLFTDIMQNEKNPDNALTTLFEEFPITELSSIKKYKRLANRADLEQVFIKRMPEELVNHYTAILKSLNENHGKIAKKTSKAFIQKATEVIQKLLEASENKDLTWGILQFQKRNA